MKKPFTLNLIILFILSILSFNSVQAQDINQSWWKNTTIYEIYVRSYQDSDGDGIGDINGIISRLDYLKSLGIETIWVSSFFTSPQGDFGYDITDYYGIQPEYGNLNSVDRLIKEVHNRGMKILLDMVLNHTSDQHPWFLESKSSLNNPKRDWYVWRKTANNWKNTANQSAWKKSEITNEYYYSAFFSFQPDLNLRNPEVIDEQKRIMRFWLDRGADGFKFDLFSNKYEDIEFRDNPSCLTCIIPTQDNPTGYFFQDQKYTLNQPEVITYSQMIREVLDEYGAMGITEAYAKSDYLSKIQYDKGKGGVQQTMLLDFLAYFKFSKEFFTKSLKDYITNFSNENNTMTHSTGNHDRARAMDMVGKGEYNKAKMYALFQFTASGNALMYQGEEIGMTRTHIPFPYAKDFAGQAPFFNIQTPFFEFGANYILGQKSRLVNRDNIRTPMQWDASKKNAGFSTAKETWLPVYGQHKSFLGFINSLIYPLNKVNVAEQESDSNSMLSAYKEIIALRNTNQIIKQGSIKIVKTSLKDILAYERTKDGETVLVLLNFSKNRIPTLINFSEVESTLYETKKNKLINKDGKVSMASFSGVVLKMKNTVPPVVGPENKITPPPVEKPIEKQTPKIKNNLVNTEITSRIVLAPVPTNNVLNIKTILEKDFISSVSIFDLTNKKIVETKFSGSSNNEIIDVSSIIAGKYVLSVTHSDGKVSREFFLKN